jgi:hypothetical protein
LLEISVQDPVGDNTGPIDVTDMLMTWDPGTGDYEITIQTDAANPFIGDFRININLFNVVDPSFFQDTFNDFLLNAPVHTLILTGNSSILQGWEIGDDVFTNSLGGTPNPPGSSLFRTSVTSRPFGFLTNEDFIAFADNTQPAVVQPGTLTVQIDIKPGSDPNTINCTNEKGVIPVTILTTPDFDAATVDHTTVTLEGASETHIDKKTGLPRRHEEDVDGDGDTDLVFHFRYGDTGLDCASTEGTLSGETFDGQAIEGIDAVRMIEVP